jgi:hypothetical protein
MSSMLDYHTPHVYSSVPGDCSCSTLCTSVRVLCGKFPSRSAQRNKMGVCMPCNTSGICRIGIDIGPCVPPHSAAAGNDKRVRGRLDCVNLSTGPARPQQYLTSSSCKNNLQALGPPWPQDMHTWLFTLVAAPKGQRKYAHLAAGVERSIKANANSMAQ